MKKLIIASCFTIALTMPVFSVPQIKKQSEQKDNCVNETPADELKAKLAGLPEIKDRWAYLSSTRFHSYYWSKFRSRKAGNIISAWLKLYINPNSPNAREEFIGKQNDKFAGVFNYENYSHSLELMEVDCRNRTSRVMSFTDYEKSGAIILSGKSSNWEPVIPDSIGENILDSLCAQCK